MNKLHYIVYYYIPNVPLMIYLLYIYLFYYYYYFFFAKGKNKALTTSSLPLTYLNPTHDWRKTIRTIN